MDITNLDQWSPGLRYIRSLLYEVLYISLTVQKLWQMLKLTTDNKQTGQKNMPSIIIQTYIMSTNSHNFIDLQSTKYIFIDSTLRIPP